MSAQMIVPPPRPLQGEDLCTLEIKVFVASPYGIPQSNGCLCTFMTWCFNVVFWLKDVLQKVHVCGRSPVCTNIWRLSSDGFWKSFPHTWQTYGLLIYAPAILPLDDHWFIWPRYWPFLGSSLSFRPECCCLIIRPECHIFWKIWDNCNWMRNCL